MSKIIFKINDKVHEVDGSFGPDVSLNEYIRNVADLKGTKAMCHEGGCGACVVAVRALVPPDNNMKLFSVNSCLVSVLSCHGWEIITVEGLGSRTIGYHEIQERVAKFNATQCGYCTPGWIMNMYSVYESKNKKLTSKEVENSFAGNLCRCTGYRSIADAFKSFATDADSRLKDKILDLEDLAFLKCCSFKSNNKCSTKFGSKNVLNTTDTKMVLIDCGTHKWFKVYNINDVFEAMKGGDYKLIAGNTGQGVYHVNHYPQHVIDIFNVNEINGYKVDVNLIIGAGMTLSEMMDLFLKLASSNPEFSYLNEFHEHMDLVAHIPVRNVGTIGGNLFMKHMNNDFQSDLFLLFETVGGMITIAEGVNKKSVKTMVEFLKTDMKKKIIVNVMLPPLSPNCCVKTYKIMPRSQNAHAVVNAGFMLKFKNNSNLLEKASIVYGSISPTFIHATKTEDLLAGKNPYTNETLQSAVKMLYDEIEPVDAPPEPSPAYRKMLAVTLYYKAILSLCPEYSINPKYRSGGKAIKRDVSHGTHVYDTDKSVWPLNKPVPKIEALTQCSGEATFANDLPKETGEVYGAFVTADVNPGSIISGFDTTEAMKIPGVITFYSAKDIPGENCFTPIYLPFITFKEELLCSKQVMYYGQPVGIIVADRERTADMAAKFVKINYAEINKKKPLLTIDDVLNSPERSKRVKNDGTIKPTETGKDIVHSVDGKFKLESQYHYYMEPQTTVAKMTEDGMELHSSIQWLDLTNVAVAKTLNVPVNSVNIIVRRVGGSYGGKISRSVNIACAAALVTHLSGKTCRFIVPLQTNMKITGKRLPTNCQFEVAVNKIGEIQHLQNQFYQDNGFSENETISPWTMHHFLNCYDTKRWFVEANSVHTDLPSSTWCRAPASTEGIAMVEYIMEKIAFEIGQDPLQVRLRNMAKDNNPIPELIDQLMEYSDYTKRTEEIKEFNMNNRWRKRAIKLIPMTYNLFYFGNYNSIVSIYHEDGSVVLMHGGIEVGQGLNTKVAQVCAFMLGIPLDKVSVKPTASFTSPNNMVIGGSIGSECVAYATLKACEILNERLKPIKETMSNYTWEELINKAYEDHVDLQASYMYSKHDNIKPYDIYGVVALEAEVDILTGNHDVRRVDLLEDVGRSLSPEIDVAQIEGAFIMGLGYWTSEKIIYDSTGKLLTDRTWTYKPPGIKDIPADFRVYFRRNAKNEFGVLQSKATGEPALCLSTVMLHVLREAVREARLDAGYPDKWVDIDTPCTVENIFMSVQHKLEHFKLK